MQALGQAYYSKANVAVLGQGDMNQMIQEVGQKPSLLVAGLVCFALACLSIWLVMKSRSIKRMAMIFCFFLFGAGFTSIHTNNKMDKALAMPKNDLYRIHFTGEPRQAASMLTDGFYEIASVEENEASYTITTTTDDDAYPLTVSLPKDSYHLEPAVKVSSDSIADLQKALN
jgi:hypothetical protein